MSQLVFCSQCGAESDMADGLCPKCRATHETANLVAAAESPSRQAKLSTESSERFVPPEPAELAAHFPQLEILELLGQGGMGAVYKARQAKLDRLVALKILPRESARDPSFAERFSREARALARLGHPNIVSIHDFGEVDGQYYFVMEFVDGADVRALLRRGQLTRQEALRIVSQVCEALQYAHDEGVVHRDVKPENILIDKRGRVKMADFGLAKLLDPSAVNFTLTASQQVMGTWHYMAPEQLERPQDVDHRADLYSLGVVLYELLTGRLPMGRFDPPSAQAGVDTRLDEIVFHALEREPEKRYQQASQLQADLKAIPDSGTFATAGGSDARQANVSVRSRVSTVTSPSCDAKVKRQIDTFAYGLLAAAAAIYASVLLLGMLNVSHGDGAFSVWKVLIWPWLLVQVFVGGLLVVAGLKMRSLEGYRLAIAASLLAVLPMGPSWLVSFPLGLWSFLGLRKDDVKAAFGVPTIWHPLKWPGRLIRMLAMLACVLWLAYGIGACVVAVQQYNGATAEVPILDLRLIATAAAIEVPLALLMCVGTFRMTAYRSRRLALAAAILAIVPIGPTLFYGIPLGIWALVLLRRADVVAEFAKKRSADDVAISAPADSAQFANAPTVPPTRS
jgi:tRNA A-37 threonylcarbamoyl transferase component Bud32